MLDSGSNPTPTPAQAAVNAVQSQKAPTESTGAQPPAVDTNDVIERKQRQLQKLQQEIQSQRQALDAKAQKYETDYVPKEQLKSDPWSVLESLGLDYDTLTKQMLERPNDPLTKSLMSKIQALEARNAASEKSQQEQTAQQYDQAKKQIANEVKLLIDADPSFETIKGAEMQDAVVELIEQTFHSSGEILEVAEAARQIEEHLMNEALKLAQLSKIKAKLAPVPEEPKAPPVVTKPQITTISQRMPNAPVNGRSSDKDRVARAMAAFKGELK